ncbi:MAG TPA: DNA-deoxyinosine glycosylase [Allosphingosinicella sp.]|jgi:hypoxanthine-DNA glycosylase
MDELKRSFPPVADARARVLVLGSLPGEQSLAQARYYAHPQNQFWRLIGEVIRRDLVPLPYEERLEALRGAGVALWDTVGAARRRGSLDGAIRDVEANALGRLADTLPELRAVGFNGGKSATMGIPQLAGREGLALVALPSSSPAFTLPFAAKLEQWQALAPFL